jgi:uncharacterized protein YggE
MTLSRYLALVASVCVLSSITNAQTVEVNQQNRTIEISAECSTEIKADRVIISVGYRNFGSTHDEAFADNARISARILKSWKDAGVTEKTVSTDELSSQATAKGYLSEWPEADRKGKQFEVFQSWRISETPDAAERLLDIAVDVGANEVGTPQWALADSDAAEAQASACALEKAHSIADQMAKSFGGKVGAVLYASNEARRFSEGGGGGVGGGVYNERKIPKTRPETKLVPQKIEKSAYVRAIFALE